MFLSDRDIRARLRSGERASEPLSDEDLQIQPASVDLRLSREFLVYRPGQVTVLDPGDPASIAASMDRVVLDEDRAFVLHPGEFALGTSVERVKIPSDLVGMVDGRSSIGRLAVVVHPTEQQRMPDRRSTTGRPAAVVHATAGLIEPGPQAHITLELSNIGSIAVK